jgi:hypothetical protein
MSKRKETPDIMSQLQGLGKATPAPEEQPEPLKKKTPQSRLAGRATYDIGPELKEIIRDEAVRLGVPASQLARYLLLYAWDDYVNGRTPSPTLLPSDSPAYRNVIDFSD